MTSDGNGRGALLSAGGILSIIVGTFELIGGGLVAALAKFSISFWRPGFTFFPGFGGDFGIISAHLAIVTIVGIALAILGIVAVVGGISAIRRRSFGLSLAGAICALLPINILGILAVIFVSLAKGEFEIEE